MSDITTANEILKKSLSVAGITDKLSPALKTILERLSGRQNLATQSVAWLIGLTPALAALPAGKRELIPEARILLVDLGLDFDPPAPTCNPLLDVLVSHYLQDIRGLPGAVETLLRPDVRAVMQAANDGKKYVWWETPEFRSRLGECDSEELMRVLKLLLPEITGAEGLFKIVEDYFRTTGLGKKR